jgi:hypothetical protein
MENKLFLIGNSTIKVEANTNDKSILESLPLIYREEGIVTFVAFQEIQCRGSSEIG